MEELMMSTSIHTFTRPSVYPSIHPSIAKQKKCIYIYICEKNENSKQVYSSMLRRDGRYYFEAL